MIKFYAVLFSGLLAGAALSAQITIDGSDVPPFGVVLTFGEDTLVAGIAPGPAGAGQSWDFLSLGLHSAFQNTVLDPAETPFSLDFPDADFALFGTDGFYSYAQVADEALLALGGSAPLPGGSSATARFDPPQKLLPAPATYGSSFDNDFGFTIFLDGAIFGVDSVQIRERGSQLAEIDAYGSLKIPSGTYETLRQRVETITIDSVFIQFFGNWIPFTAAADTTIAYEWWAKEGRGRVLSLEYDAAGNALSATHLTSYGTALMAPVAAFSYELLPDGQVQFADASQFDPASWSWDFGDGAGSTEQNPVHAYAASGMYQVCLTVANLAGQDASCQEVVIVISSDEGEQAAGSVRAYPSPVADKLNVDLGALAGQSVRLSLFNGLGQLVKQERLENAAQNISLPMADLRPGIYRLLVEADGKRVKVLGVSKL